MNPQSSTRTKLHKAELWLLLTPLLVAITIAAALWLRHGNSKKEFTLTDLSGKPLPLVILPNVQDAEGSVAVLVQPPPKTITAAATLAHQVGLQVYKLKDWDRVEVLIITNAQAAARYKDYQSKRQNQIPLESDYPKLSFLWKYVPIRMICDRDHVATYYPDRSPQGWFWGDKQPKRMPYY